jgi:hypothetical protein
MRMLAVALLCILVAGCGLARMQERKEQMAAATMAKDQGTAACKAQYPNKSKDLVAANRCYYEAARIMLPFITYPDLFEQQWAASSALAQQVDARKVTLADAELQLAERHSQIVAEEQRRSLANRSVSAQEIAAQNVGGPNTCTRIGNTVNCY